MHATLKAAMDEAGPDSTEEELEKALWRHAWERVQAMKAGGKVGDLPMLDTLTRMALVELSGQCAEQLRQGVTAPECRLGLSTNPLGEEGGRWSMNVLVCVTAVCALGCASLTIPVTDPPDSELRITLAAAEEACAVDGAGVTE